MILEGPFQPILLSRPERGANNVVMGPIPVLAFP